MSITSSVVKTSQGNISYLDSHGSGQPIVFIHGNSACKEVFSHQYTAPAFNNHRIIAIDLPGHGASDKARDPEKTYSIPGYADVVIELIKKLKLEKPVIVGWSLGGHIGIDMISKTTTIAGLLITGTPPVAFSPEGLSEGFLPLETFQRLGKKLVFTEDEAKEFMSVGGFDPKADSFVVEAVLKTDGRARELMLNAASSGIGENQKTIVEKNETLLCIVQGENDKGINNEYIAKKINFRNLYNKVHIIPSSGHAVFFEKHEEFNKILSDFSEHVASLKQST